jgi:hypothetical protein
VQLIAGALEMIYRMANELTGDNSTAEGSHSRSQLHPDEQSTVVGFLVEVLVREKSVSEGPSD